MWLAAFTDDASRMPVRPANAPAGTLSTAGLAALADPDRSGLADIALPPEGRAASRWSGGSGDRPGERAGRGRC